MMSGKLLQLLFLLVLALIAFNYLFSTVLDMSPFGFNSYRIKTVTSWPKVIQSSSVVAIQETDCVTNSISSESEVESTSNLKTSHDPMPQNIIAPSHDTPWKISSHISTLELDLNKNGTRLPLCPKMPPGLGPITANKTEIELEAVERRFPEVRRGGRYRPAACAPRHRVAIIVPYRDRQQHLAIFLNHMHPFLMKQQIDYGIFIIEQQGASDFNRAKLMNVGFAESQRARRGGWQCFVFHDIDLLPLDGRNLYTCPRQPRHMSASVDTLDFKLPYPEIFGGVSAMTLEQFQKVNGFSNKYWGWGGEDDDMFYRLEIMNYHIARYKMSIARYTMTKHREASPNPRRYDILSQMGKMFLNDGLSTLSYELVKWTQRHLYTHVLVDIDERS